MPNIDRAILPDSETVCTVAGKFPFYWEELFEWVEAYRKTPLGKKCYMDSPSISAAIPSFVAGYMIGVRSERAHHRKAGRTIYPNLIGQKVFHKLTAEQMGQIAGLSGKSFESKMQSGRFTPAECKAYCEHFGKSFDFLFATEGENA